MLEIIGILGGIGVLCGVLIFIANRVLRKNRKVSGRLKKYQNAFRG